MLWYKFKDGRSSTYFQRSDSNVFRLFTITKNKVGPNFFPWGTPLFTCAHPEIDSPSLTLCVRLDKKSHNHGIRDLRSSMSINLVINTLKLILSNTLLRSSKTIRSEHLSVSSLETRNETCQVGIE